MGTWQTPRGRGKAMIELFQAPKKREKSFAMI